jgi:hypothetical protein
MRKRKHHDISDAEEAVIKHCIAEEPDAAEIPAESIKAVRPFSELVAKKRTGRPWIAQIKNV